MYITMENHHLVGKSAINSSIPMSSPGPSLEVGIVAHLFGPGRIDDKLRAFHGDGGLRLRVEMIHVGNTRDIWIIYG